MNRIKVDVEDLPKGAKTPFLSHARKLLKEGYPEDTKVEFYRNGGKEPDVIINNIGRASLWTVLEDRRQGPRFVKYKDYVHSYAKKTQTPHVGVKS